MENIDLLIELHKDGARQGPGSEAETLRALELSQLDKNRSLSIADIGCGTGASTIILAQEFNATIKAVDLFPDFLDIRIDCNLFNSTLCSYAPSMFRRPLTLPHCNTS